MYPRNPQTPADTLPEWVLVANAARARCFERDPGNGALRELEGFVHPASRLKGQDLGSDRGGLAYKGAASTQYSPPTDLHEKEHAQFARELVRYLEQAALDHRFGRLALVASNPFLGELRSQLGAASQRVLAASVASDLTAFAGRDLEQRVTKALAAPVA
jgi:protein required for attachment to host cells